MNKIYRYPGSRPFTIEDKSLFFGRDNDIAEISKFINVEKLVVLYGRSGLGKSSVINAGVLPKLESEAEYIPIPIRLNSFAEINQIGGQGPTTPSEIFSEKLSAAIQEYYQRNNIQYNFSEDFLAKIDTEHITPWQKLKSLYTTILKTGSKKTILLVFDQFEELFTYPHGIEIFSQEIAELLNQIIPRDFKRTLKKKLYEQSDLLTDEELYALDELLEVKILFSIRSDKLNLLNRLTNEIPTVLRNCYELLPLTREKATTAIIRPARKRGEEFISPAFHYSPEALDKILDYLTQNDTKEIESFQLQILCQHVEENIVIPKEDDFIEGDDIGDLKTVYQNYYDIQISKLSTEEDRTKARILIEDGLIFEEEERRVNLYEGQIIKSYNISAQLLQELVDTHLLRSEPSQQGGFTYELSHDSLVAPILKSKVRRKSEENFLIKQRETQAKLEAEQKQRKIQNYRFLWGAGILVIILIIISSFGIRTYFSELTVKNQLDANKIATIALQKEKDDPTMGLCIVKRGEKDHGETFALMLVRNEILSKNIFYINVFKNNRVQVNAVACHPSNKYFLIGNKKGVLLATGIGGDTVGLADHGEDVLYAAFTRDGKNMMTAGSKKIKYWEFNPDKKEIKLVNENFEGKDASNITAILLTPDGQNIIATNENRKIMVWDMDGTQLKKIENKLSGYITSISVSPRSNDQLVVASREGEVALLNLLKNDYTIVGDDSESKAAHEPGIVKVAFSNNGRYFLSYNSKNEDDKMVQIWDLKGKRVNRVNYSSPFNTAFFSPSDDSIYTGCRNGKIILWDSKTRNKKIQELKGHLDEVTSMACSPNGRYVISGSGPLGNEDRSALLWDMKAQQNNAFRMKERNSDYKALSFSCDGKQFISSDLDKGAVLWETGEKEFRQKNTLNQTTDIALDIISFSTDGKEVILANSKGKLVELWNLENNTSNSVKTGETEIKCLALTPGKDSIIISNGSSMLAYSTDGQKREYFYLEEKGVVSMAFSPDSKYLVVGKDDNRLILYSLNKNKPEKGEIIGVHNEPITSIAFSPDSKFILTGSDDKTLKVWDIRGRELETINTGMSLIKSVAIRPSKEDPKRFDYLAVDDGGNVLVFDDLLTFVERIASIYDDEYFEKSKRTFYIRHKEDVIKRTIENEIKKYQLND